MIVKTIGFPGEKKFKFYTYDILGREIKSPYDTMMDVIGNPRYEF